MPSVLEEFPMTCRQRKIFLSVWRRNRKEILKARGLWGAWQKAIEPFADKHWREKYDLELALESDPVEPFDHCLRDPRRFVLERTQAEMTTDVLKDASKTITRRVRTARASVRNKIKRHKKEDRLVIAEINEERVGLPPAIAAVDEVIVAVDEKNPIEAPSSPSLLAEIPAHWQIGGTSEFAKSDIAWAIHHLHLPVEANQCPTPAAWNLLQIGRDSPGEFMAKWGAIALPKKDAEETEKRLDDDCLDLLTDLRVELARMQQLALVGPAVEMVG